MSRETDDVAMKTYTDEELNTLDPELAKIFSKGAPRKLPVPDRKTLPVFRKNYNAAIARYTRSPLAKAVLGAAFDNPTWTETDQSIPVRDGATIKIRTYVPKESPCDGAPVIVFFHGGGWFMGDLDTEALTCRIFAAKLGLAVVNVDFRLYPEVEFGVPAEDCIDSVRWVAENASSFGGNLDKAFIVGGISGGATYAAIATHLLREDAEFLKLGKPITGCYYSCPIFPDETGSNDFDHVEHIFDLKTENRSFEQHKNAPLMNRAMQRSISTFATYDFNSPYIGPFHCNGDLGYSHVPRTYSQVCGFDPWRDTAVIYDQKIREAGSETRLTMYPGLPHAWWTTFPQVSATRTYMKDLIQGVEWLLHRSTLTSAERL